MTITIQHTTSTEYTKGTGDTASHLDKHISLSATNGGAYLTATMPTIFDVKDKVIAITGGSGGIGFATAQLLVSQGAKVSIADVSETALEEADSKLKQAQYPGEFMTTAVDVRKPQEVNEWIRSTVDKFGRLDGAANMAAVIPKNINIDRVEDMPDEDWQFVIDVNLNGGIADTPFSRNIPLTVCKSCTACEQSCAT